MVSRAWAKAHHSARTGEFRGRRRGPFRLAVAAVRRTGAARSFAARLAADSALCLWGYVAYLFATWWLFTHRLDRFWLPLLPPLAVLAGLGADWARNRGWSVLLARS